MENSLTPDPAIRRALREPIKPEAGIKGKQAALESAARF